MSISHTAHVSQQPGTPISHMSEIVHQRESFVMTLSEVQVSTNKVLNNCCECPKNDKLIGIVKLTFRDNITRYFCMDCLVSMANVVEDYLASELKS